MKTIKKYLILLFAVCFIVSCEKPNNENPQKEIQGCVVIECPEGGLIEYLEAGLIKHSNCKDFTDKHSKSSDVPANVSQVNHSYDISTSALTLDHLNATFNCCPSRLYCDISIQNDTIIIEEKEDLGGGLACNCNCLYDLEILVTEVEAKKYIIKFIEPYYQGDEKLIFEIDLIQKTEDSYSVIRDSYPWGFNQ